MRGPFAEGVGLEPTSPFGQRFSRPRASLPRNPSSHLTMPFCWKTRKVSPPWARMLPPRPRKGMAGEWQQSTGRWSATDLGGKVDARKGFILQPGEGRSIDLGNFQMTVKATSE